MPLHERELPVPPEAFVDPGANEVLRTWLVDGGLRIVLYRAFSDPGFWGGVLADVARNAAEVYEKQGVCTRAEALSRIRAQFDAAWGDPAAGAAQ